MSREILVCKLGHAAYQPTWELQHALQKRLIRAKREKPYERLPHLLLLVEHPHVYTIGKSGNHDHLLADDETLTRRSAQFVQVDRGGDITYHGPGQLVGYPILDLDRIFTDLHKYLRALEEVIIQTCDRWGVKGFRVNGRTGVWVDGNRQDERKICAFGVRCSRWVTMHGWALNINTDLSYFDEIIPCGIQDRGVTSLQNELEHEVSMSEVTEVAIDRFAARFNLTPVVMDAAESYRALEGMADVATPSQA